MACRQSDGAMIQANVINTIKPEVSISVRQLDDTINECYNDKMSEKAIMQIRR